MISQVKSHQEILPLSVHKNKKNMPHKYQLEHEQCTNLGFFISNRVQAEPSLCIIEKPEVLISFRNRHHIYTKKQKKDKT